MHRLKSNLKNYLVFGLFLIAAVLSVIFARKVVINYNISDYLDDSTETKISLNILEDEFGKTGDIQVMIRDIDPQTAAEVRATLKEIPNVLNVSFDASDESRYRDGNALFVVLTDGDEYSDAAYTVASDIKAALEGRFGEKVCYGGAVIRKQNLQTMITGEMKYILAIALCLVAAIMLLTSSSWLEPLLLLGTSGVAVLLNMGTNVLLGEISYITRSVASILQLALSIDYSIVLLHSYRARKQTEPDCETAMAGAVRDVVKPVSASALTTVAGLLALLFMSFRIGFDIGIVLIKGILLSAVTSLTLLPVLLLVSDRLLQRTHKRALVPQGKKFCGLAFRASKTVVPLALVLILVCGVLQAGNSYTFTDAKTGEDAIFDTFGQNNTVVVIYERGENDYETEKALADRLSTYRRADGSPVLKGYTAYSNTVMAEYDIDAAQSKLGLSREDAELLFALYQLSGNSAQVKLSPLEFVQYTDHLLDTDPDAGEMAGEEVRESVRLLVLVSEIMNGRHTATQLHALLSQATAEPPSLSSIEQLYLLYSLKNQTLPVGGIVGRDLIGFLIRTYPDTPAISEQLSETQKRLLADMCTADAFLTDTCTYDFREMTTLFGELTGQIGSVPSGTAPDADTVLGVYVKYAAEKQILPETSVMAYRLLEFVDENMESGGLLSRKLTPELRDKIRDAKAEVSRAQGLFLGERHSRMLLSVDLPREGDESEAFVQYLLGAVKETFGDGAHIAGEMVSVSDLRDTFDRDNRLISIFTILSIFVIVMLVFRSLSLPVLLVAAIQGAIWISMSVSRLTGPMFFMSYIVTTCILMGATIDYGILMSTNYIRFRQTLDKKESLYRSVGAAMPTVFTSGLILTVCGFVIGLIASQNAISSVGLLLGRGALVSILMITLVLPSALYLLDSFILKFSLKEKQKPSSGQ